MAYQPPGPYPVMPMQPVHGTPQRPPIPKAVLHSYYSIIVGGVLSAVTFASVFFQLGKVRSELENNRPHLSAAHIHDVVVLAVAVVAIIGVLELLLWAWMAWKVRTGRHWARVTSTVLFAVNAVGQIFGSSGAYAGLAGDGHENAAQQPIFAVILGWAILAAGLNAVVLFWQKSANPFFRPQQFFHPGGYGYPYPYPFPPQGYPTEQYAQAPVQGGFAPEEQGQPQPPADPWSTPHE